jgi:hypothetical protein
VVLRVVGSNPISHPRQKEELKAPLFFAIKYKRGFEAPFINLQGKLKPTQLSCETNQKTMDFILVASSMDYPKNG